MSDWNQIATRRFKNAIDEMRKIANTAAKRYDVDSAAALTLLAELDDAYQAMREAYAPRIGGESPETGPKTIDSGEKLEGLALEIAKTRTPEDAPEGKIKKYDIHPLSIAHFVHNIPQDHFPAWALHVANRMVGLAVEEFEEGN